MQNLSAEGQHACSIEESESTDRLWARRIVLHG